MIIFTVAMIISYTICLVLNLVEKRIPKSDELKKLDSDTRLGYVAIGCIGGIYMLTHLISYIIYLFNSLNADPLLYPTWIMLGIIVLNMIVGGIKALVRKITKSEKNNKTTFYNYLLRFITYLYFVYMLYILIVGI